MDTYCNLYIHSCIRSRLDEGVGGSSFWLLTNKAAVNIHGHIFIWTYALIPFGLIPKSEWLNNMEGRETGKKRLRKQERFIVRNWLRILGAGKADTRGRAGRLHLAGSCCRSPE